MNETIHTQMNHKSIRAFTNEKLTEKEILILLNVAQRTATSNFLQAYSIIGVTDEKVKNELAKIANQDYVAQASHVFVFIVDQNRNVTIAKEKGQETHLVRSMDYFMQGYADSLLAAQNVVIAAESLQLGTVFLGSLLNNAPRIIELLNLPDYTFPALGVAIGHPDQSPQLKPRLPQKIIYHENKYQKSKNLLNELTEYDQVVQTYYDLRNSNQRVDSFTNQVATKLKKQNPVRAQLLDQIKKQHLIEY